MWCFAGDIKFFFIPQIKGVEVTGVKRVFVEGEDCDDWMVVDMGE